MAEDLKNTIINDTGYIQLPSGTIAQRPASPSQGMIRWNSELTTKEYYNGTEWIMVSPYYTSVSQITGPSGFYYIDILNEGLPQLFYINQDYDGGGWVCVLANRSSTGGMKNLTYSNAVNQINYRNGTSDATNAVASPGPGPQLLSDYNIWVGTKFWTALGNRVTSGKTTVVQFVATTNGTALNSSHTKRYRWRFGSFNSTYQFVDVESISDETSTGAPGFYSYHAVNGYSLTTYDQDQDDSGSNCSTNYNNNPWWYGACWNGNYFAGGGYQDAPYWSGSGSDYHQYGAVYIK